MSPKQEKYSSGLPSGDFLLYLIWHTDAQHLMGEPVHSSSSSKMVPSPTVQHISFPGQSPHNTASYYRWLHQQ